MQVQIHRFLGNGRIYITTTLLLLSSFLLRAQSPEASIIGTWEGTIFSNVPATHGAKLHYVFSPQSEYT